MDRQIELLPLVPKTAAERRELIRRRLDGFELRQAARQEKRRQVRDRRRAGPAGPDARQVTLEEAIEREKMREQG